MKAQAGGELQAGSLFNSVSATSHMFCNGAEDGATLCVCHRRQVEFLPVPRRYAAPNDSTGISA